jgi:hypothetical protein
MDKKEMLIAYLNKNLEIAKHKLGEYDEINKELELLKKEIETLEGNLAAIGPVDNIKADIAEIAGFIDDLTSVEKQDEVVEEHNVEAEVEPVEKLVENSAEETVTLNV